MASMMVEINGLKLELLKMIAKDQPFQTTNKELAEKFHVKPKTVGYWFRVLRLSGMIQQNQKITETGSCREAVITENGIRYLEEKR